jgi:hypothetical protein
MPYGAMDEQAYPSHDDIMRTLDANDGEKKAAKSWNPFTKTVSKADQNQTTRTSQGSKSEANLRVKFVGYAPDLEPLINKNPGIANLKQLDNPVIALASPPKTPFIESFRPDNFLREGSIRGSIFNLCSATLGAGALSLPFAFKQSGFVMGIILLIIASLATTFSIRLLILSSNKTGLNSYETLTVAMFGQRVGILVEFCIIVFCFGTSVAYIVAVGDVLERSVLEVFKDQLPEFMTRKFLMSLFFFTVMFPLSLFDKINSLRFASLFGIASIFFLVL